MRHNSYFIVYLKHLKAWSVPKYERSADKLASFGKKWEANLGAFLRQVSDLVVEQNCSVTICSRISYENIQAETTKMKCAASSRNIHKLFQRPLNKNIILS